MTCSSPGFRGAFLLLLAGALPAAADVAGAVFDAGGRPIAGARVAAHAAEPTAGRAARWTSAAPERPPAVGRSGPLVTVTDAAGRFTLRGEPDALLFVEASADGFVPAQTAVLPDDRTAVLVLEEGVEVGGRVLGDGAPLAGATVVWPRREGHDVVARSDGEGRFRFTAPRAGAVAGLLAFHPGFAPSRADRWLAPGESIVLERGRRLAGVVVDARRRPVAGAALEVDGLPAGASGEDGRFALDHQPAGALRLRATAADGRVGEAAVTGGAGAPGDAVEVVVAPAGRIEGTVRLEHGGARRGLAGAAVTVHPLSGGGADDGGRFERSVVEVANPQPLVVVAGAGGRYAVDGLLPGRYALTPLLGLERRVRQDEMTTSDGEGDPHVVVLGAGERATRDLDLVLPPAVRGRVVDAAGLPVGGAAVAVVPEREAAAHLAFDPEGPRTDADGRFEIPLLWIGGPQRLQVVVARRGHSPARSAPFALTADAAGAGGGARDVRIDVRLAAEAPVRARVTGSGGAPVAGARVAFLLEEGGWGRTPPVEMLLDAPGAALVTSAAGLADLHLAPGSYRLAAAADGYQTLVRDLEVRGGGASTLDLALEPAVEIVGRVVRAGRPVPGVHVHLPIRTRLDEPLRTGADGVFRIPNLAPGEYRLVFVADEGSLHEERTVAAPSRDFVLELPPAGTLALLVTGRDTGEPVEGVAVEVLPLDDEGPEAPARPRRHHGDRGGGGGRIEVPAVPAGEVEVLVGAAGYLPSGPHRVVVRADRVTELAVALDPGAEVVGTVTGDGGEPLAGARVSIAPPGPVRGPQLRVAPPAAATEPDGSFRLRGVAAGPVVVHVQAEGYVPHREELEIAGDRRLDVRLGRGLTLSGVVTAGGEPLAGAQVGASTAALGGEHQSAVSDEAGRFTLTGLVAARYTVSAYRDGYRQRQLEAVDPRRAEELVLDLSPEATATIEGVLRGVPAAAGGGLPHQAVSAQGDAGGAEAVVEPDGGFRIEGVPAGVVRVQAWVESEEGGFQSSPVTVEVAAGQVAWVELDVGAALTVSGRVTVEGEPVAGARLIFNTPDGTSASAVAGADGEYSLGLPRPGAYTVVVHHEPRLRMHYQAVHEIASSRRLDLDVREGWLRGVVLDEESGEPIDEAFVTLLSTGGAAALHAPVAEAMTDRRGRFTLAAAVPGPFELLAGAAGYGQGRLEVGGAGRDVVLELRRTAGLRVRVVEAGGELPLQAHLVVREASGATLPPRVEPRADGTQELSLAPGRYLVTAIVAGYGQRTVAAEAPGDLSIELGPAGGVIVETAPHLAGRLHLFDAAGVEAQPCCHPPGWPTTGAVTAIPGLAAGRYRLELRDPHGAVLAAAAVVVEPVATTRVRLD